MKVKIFAEADEEELEKKINEFIAGKKVIDIKLSQSSTSELENEDGGIDIFTAMIMYE